MDEFRKAHLSRNPAQKAGDPMRTDSCGKFFATRTGAMTCRSRRSGTATSKSFVSYCLPHSFHKFPEIFRFLYFIHARPVHDRIDAAKFIDELYNIPADFLFRADLSVEFGAVQRNKSDCLHNLKV